jgi:mycothiol S-conjugate amidase
MAMHAKFLELGIESPFSEEWFDRPGLDHRITTRIEIAPEDDVRRDALLAHATQIDPASPFWFGLPADADREYPWDDYILARSLVDAPVPEDDLFAGLRQPARR